jgi:plasmid stabilization system protein ParE
VLRITWSNQAARDLDQIADFWLDRDPKRGVGVLEAIDRRVHWLADDRSHLGIPVPGLPPHRRWYLERRYEYKIYYRIVGEPLEDLLVLRIRSARQRPLGPPEITRTSTTTESESEDEKD